jgi:Xaa-Pro aminopeptidase
LSNRADRLAELLPEAGVDLMLVSGLVNVRYLAGYTGSNGLALVGPDFRAFITDFRYVEQAAEEVEDTFERITAQQELLDAVPEFLPDGVRRLGFEDSDLTVRAHARLVELLGDSVALIPAGGLVEQLRAIKEPEEIARILAATEIADAAYAELIAEGLVGRTESDVALALCRKMRERGASGPSFGTIVGAGPHGALPHATPREVPIERDQLVVIDWGAHVDGYCSDCTRTVATGEISEQAREVYALVLEAQLRGLDAVRAGAVSREVDATARMVIEAGGYGEAFGHNLGHGVGLDIHEAPGLSRRSDAALEAGNVVTVEPGIYLPGQFGVRIEDLALVTEDGARVLTGIPKELTVCG